MAYLYSKLAYDLIYIVKNVCSGNKIIIKIKNMKLNYNFLKLSDQNRKN